LGAQPNNRECDSLETQEISSTSKAQCLQPSAKWFPWKRLFYLDDVRGNFDIMSDMIPIQKRPLLFCMSQREQIYRILAELVSHSSTYAGTGTVRYPSPLSITNSVMKAGG
jgi:hypothetical protein